MVKIKTVAIILKILADFINKTFYMTYFLIRYPNLQKGTRQRN